MEEDKTQKEAEDGDMKQKLLIENITVTWQQASNRQDVLMLSLDVFLDAWNKVNLNFYLKVFYL